MCLARVSFILAVKGYSKWSVGSKKVLIVGRQRWRTYCRRVGESGVGHFILMDFDRIELHNIARLSVGERIGTAQSKCVKDAILLKNPYAQVETYDIDMNKHLDILKNVWQNRILHSCDDEYAQI